MGYSHGVTKSQTRLSTHACMHAYSYMGTDNPQLMTVDYDFSDFTVVQ